MEKFKGQLISKRLFGIFNSSKKRTEKFDLTKGQLISKADWRAIDSPKKRTDEFDLFAVKSKKAKKTNLFVRFLGESMARQSAFEINWPLI